MINYSIKLFFLYFLTIASSLHAMENENNEKFVQTNKNQALLDAIAIGYNNDFSQEDWKNIINCFENGADINLLIGQGEITPLTMAVMYQNKELFNYLLKKGALVNVCGQSGWTTLHYISSLLRKKHNNFDLQMFIDLLNHGANVSAQTTKTKKTPLLFIAKYGNSNLVKLLIQHKTDINQFSGKYKPLWFAIKNDNIETTKTLLSQNASLTEIDKHNCTIFHLMAYFNKPQEFFTTVIKYARFTPILTQEIINSNKSVDESAFELLLILKNSIKPSIPLDLHFRILSMLPGQYFQDPRSEVCKKLLSLGYKNPFILACVNRHVQCLHEILSIKNNTETESKNALEYLQHQNSSYIAQIAPLLDKNAMENDLKILNEKFPEIINQENNLISKIFKNYANSV